MNKERFEAFSDGVFAFAITLLVLGVALPAFRRPPSDTELTSALVGLWPNVVAFALSFGVIGIMWQNHHSFFRVVTRVDRTTVFLNLLLLGGTVFIAFATATLGSYPTTHSATFLYGLTLSYTATIYNLLPMHLIRRKAFTASVTDEALKGMLVAYRVGWVTYVCAMLISLWMPLLSFALYIAITVYYLVPRGLDQDLEGV